MTTEKSSGKIRSRSIYLLPNLFTVGALFAGFYSIISAIQGSYENAAIAIFVAMLLDGLDGRVARLTHTQSEFGAQMDSLSDMVCFGVTPSIVIYLWALKDLGKIGWLVAFVYTVCTALRLARFNSMDENTDKRYFKGLSTPIAAGVLASMLWVCSHYQITGGDVRVIVLLVAVFLAFLKVSTVPYRSFKDFDARNKVPFLAVVLVMLVFVFIAADPPDVFLTLFSLYVLSGPAGLVWRFLRRGRQKRDR